MGIIERQYGRHVEIEMLRSTDRKESLRDINVDEIIKGNIHIEVEEETE